MARQFKFIASMEKGSGDGILDIPHPAILRYRSPSQLIEDFRKDWGQKPKGVVLPITTPDGLLFDIKDSGLQVSTYRYFDDSSKDIFDAAFEFAQLNQDIYLLLDPSLQFVQTNALHITDIAGDNSPQVCIGNRRAQEMIGMLLGTGMDLLKERLSPLDQHGKTWKLAGIILDAVDLLPMGTSDNGRLELTCFCESCRKFFSDEQPDLLKQFDTFPNPWNLVLKDSGTGISYIQSLPKSISGDEIIGLSRKKAFDLIFEKEIGNKDDATLASYAKHLKSYMQVRHLQITQAIAAIFKEALNGFSEDPAKNPKRIILTEGDYYSWTAGIQLDRLDEVPTIGKSVPCDEVWFDSTSPNMYTENIPFRSYMWRRSRYFIDAFFQVFANSGDPVQRSITSFARLSKDEVRDLLRRRLQTAIGYGSEKGKVALAAALPELDRLEEKLTRSKRIGFVGAALTQEIGTELINKLQIADGLSGKASSLPQDQKQITDLLRMLSSLGDGSANS